MVVQVSNFLTLAGFVICSILLENIAIRWAIESALHFEISRKSTQISSTTIFITNIMIYSEIPLDLDRMQKVCRESL